MCYVYNQWYDISCATLYILNELATFITYLKHIILNI